MDLEEKKEKVAHMHKYFVKSFWFSVILLIIFSALTMMMRGHMMGLMARYFQMQPRDWDYIVFLVYGFWKILIIQFTLIPALVLWDFKRCMEHGCKREVL